jgi:putative flippase GtrA
MAFLRFSLVGGAGFVVDAAVFFLLVQAAGKAWWLARLLAFLAAVGVTWAGNRWFTFGSRGRPWSEGLRYLGVQSLGCAVNYGVFLACVMAAGAERGLLLPYLAGTAAALVSNYLLSRHYVFRNPSA